MKIIVNKNTGKVLYCVLDTPNLQEEEIEIDGCLTESFICPFYNFEYKIFYEGATPIDIEAFNNVTMSQNKKEAYEKLKETDWYIIRFNETGKEIPQDILKLREKIRNSN